MPSLFFSAYPSKLEIGPVPDDQPTLATALSEAGYATAGFHSNPYLSRAFGFDRGFDTFEDSLPLASNRVFAFLNRVVNYVRTVPYERAATHNQQALDWLDATDDGPRFVWIHYMDPHGPYQPPATYQSEFCEKTVGKRRAKRLWRRMVDEPGTLTEREVKRLGNLYDAEIRYTDAMIGEFLDDLSDRGLLEQSTVVVAADHGELFGEHDMYGHPRRLYENLIHVPLFVKRPGDESSHTRIDRPVENIDVAATILDSVDQPVPDSFEGDPLPATPSEYDDLEPAAVAECRGEGDEEGRQRFAVRTSRYKYCIELDEEWDELSSALYDLGESGKHRDETENRPEIRRALETRLPVHLDRDRPRDVDGQADSHESAVVEQRLRDLGYR